MLRRDSIRWRLPFTYAGIALITALALGAVLLATVRAYYLRQERLYLLGNAQAISFALGRVLEDDLPPEAIQAQVEGLGFFSRTRVRLFDPQGQVIADSGPPQGERAFAVRVEAPPPGVEEASEPEAGAGLRYGWSFGAAPLPDDSFTVPIAPAAGGGAPAPPTEVLTVTAGNGDFLMFISGSDTLYGFGMGEMAQKWDRRSTEKVEVPVPADGSGAVLGTVELSEGPAYGREIIGSVARWLAVASLAAVLLAAGVGWGASQRLSAPLIGLADTARRMAQGDLTARADLDRADEIGLLAGAFNDMATRIEETVNALRRFVSDAAHQLHTPLTALRTNLELAGDDPGPARRAAYLERGLDQMRRLERLTTSLLDLSRVEAGVEAEHRPVDLVALVASISEVYASRAEQSGLTFGLDLPDEPVWVAGDDVQLQHAVGNLLGNALKFTPSGGSVRVGVSSQGDQAVMWIEDSGIGIPDEDLPLLFSRFHRGRNTASYPGNGLGLAIVKAIIERHGGTVGVTRREAGTRFEVRLPLATIS